MLARPERLRFDVTSQKPTDHREASKETDKMLLEQCIAAEIAKWEDWFVLYSEQPINLTKGDKKLNTVFVEVLKNTTETNRWKYNFMNK